MVEMRGLPYSDCYRRSIACSRRGSHGDAVLRFFKIAINPRIGIKKEQPSLFLFWWRCGICSKQSLRNSEVYELTRRRSVSPGTGVHVAKQRHGFCRAKSPLRNKKRNSLRCSFFVVEMRGFEPRFVLLHPTPSTCLFGD